MKRLTIGAFAWAVMSAVLLAPLSQAGERVMRPEFGAGLKATKAPATASSTPAPTPTTGPGGEEIFTDEMKRVFEDDPAWFYPGDEEATTDEESGGVRFGDGVRGKRAPEEKDKKTDKETPPWLYSDEQPDDDD